MQRGNDIARTMFAVLFIGALLGGSIWILWPFVGPGIWATMVVVTTWTLMLRIQAKLWQRRWLAVTVMTLLLLLLFVVPLAMAIVTIVDSADQLVSWAKLAADYHLPPVPPRWVVDLPLVGSTIERAWAQATVIGVRELLPRLSPYAGNVTRWFVGQVGGIGTLMLQFFLTVVVAAVLYGMGESAADLVRRFARRLGGSTGVGAVELAGSALRGVALGVGVTAVIQAVLAAIGLGLAGVPFTGLLTAVTFMFCLAQVGPVPVLLPAAIWAIWAGSTGWGIFLLVWAAVVATIDNVLRPWLIQRGADLPLVLIFAGVIGGLFAFGLVGIFVGPVVLAVSYTLLEAWIKRVETAQPQADAVVPVPPLVKAPLPQLPLD